MKNLSFILILMLVGACSNTKKETAVKSLEFSPTDKNATSETVALYNSLFQHQGEGMMFGHQDDLAYGVGWWGGEFNSDVQLVSGKFPAVFGWDAGEIGTERNIDSVLFDDMQKWMIKVFEKGGVNTLSWHLDNPVTGGDAWDRTPAVQAIIPGGEMHEKFKETLDLLADFLSGLQTENGVYVPVILRPWHEHSGSWFWWGEGNCSVEDYVALWRFTVEYLRDVKGLHHLLYAYSTDSFGSREEYLERFPGEEYIDLLGFDDYHSFTKIEGIEHGLNSMRILAQLGEEMQKPFAMTETGLEKLPNPEWYTKHILESIKSDSLARKLSYMLVWRNGRPDHFYAPFPGHESVPGFIKFEKDPFTWFLEDLPDMYSGGK